MSFGIYLKKKLIIGLKIKKKEMDLFGNDTIRTCLMKLLLVELGNEEGYYVETEAFPHIDIGYFSNSSKTEWAKWSFEIAIEHENKKNPSWQEECSKLMGINAGLKVLISYFSETKEKLYDEINEFSDIYQSRLYHQKEDKYLFIFIPLNDCIKIDKYFVYKFYDDKLINIQGNPT